MTTKLNNMKTNFLYFLIWSVVLLVFLRFTPNDKIVLIGDFFKKIITPLAVPISLVIGAFLGIVKYKKIIKNKKNKLL